MSYSENEKVKGQWHCRTEGRPRSVDHLAPATTNSFLKNSIAPMQLKVHITSELLFYDSLDFSVIL